MALVKCPECGKENVSNEAEMCPNCGYNLKKYYDDLELTRIKEEQEKKELSKIQMPSKPNIFFDFGVSFLIFGLFGIFVLIFVPNPFNIIGFVLFISVMIAEGIKLYKKDVHDYHLALTNFEQYQKEQLKEQEERERREALERQRKAMKNVSPKCPYCGSFHTSKIGVVTRGVSVGLVGLASSKIGKQWHCNNCNSDF